MIRRIALTTALLPLLCGLAILWSVRYERLPLSRPITLTGVQEKHPVPPAGAEWRAGRDGPVLRLRVASGESRIGWKIPLPEMGAVEALHIRIHLASRELILGPQKWDDGRVLIEWRSEDGLGGEEIDPLCSVRDCEDTGKLEMVVRAHSGRSRPVLWIEHLGRSGEMELIELRMIPVRQREIWSRVSWGMAFAWFLWLMALAFPRGQGGFRRSVICVAIWLTLGVMFAFPGPWKTLRPFIKPFDLGPEKALITPRTLHHSAASAESTGHPAPKQLPDSAPPPAATTETLGKLPAPGGWIIRIKQSLPFLRPLMHALMLALPTLVFTFLLGRKRAVMLAASLALAIEGAQTGFGYGFDWVDVFDLLTNAAGIALALWFFSKCRGRDVER